MDALDRAVGILGHEQRSLAKRILRQQLAAARQLDGLSRVAEAGLPKEVHFCRWRRMELLLRFAKTTGAICKQHSCY